MGKEGIGCLGERVWGVVGRFGYFIYFLVWLVVISVFNSTIML